MNADIYLCRMVRSRRGNKRGFITLGNFLRGVRLGWWRVLEKNKAMRGVELTGSGVAYVTIDGARNKHVSHWAGLSKMMAREPWALSVYVCAGGAKVLFPEEENPADRIKEMGFAFKSGEILLEAAFDPDCYVADYVGGKEESGHGCEN